MARLIHLSDLHFGAHDDRLVEAVEARVDEAKPDLVVICGDFTQRARTEQFEQACEFLTRLRENGHEVLGVPGNHDVPLYDVLRRFLSPLARYRRYIDETLCPFLDLPDMTVLGINTARSLTFKDGHINHEQIGFIRECFASTSRDKPRILIMHHPLFAHSGRRRAGAGGRDGTINSARSTRSPSLASTCCWPATTTVPASIMPRTWCTGQAATLVIQAGTATSTRVRDEQQSFNLIDIAPRRGDRHGAALGRR